jgi:hypothetical protein
MATRLMAIALSLAAAFAVLGCGQKYERVPGAEKMTDAEKRAQVQAYVNKWCSEVRASFDKKKSDGFGADLSVEKDKGGCDIGLGEFTELITEGLAEAGVTVLSPAPGTAKVKVLYKLPPNGDPAKAECRVTIGLSAAGAAAHVASYSPDPRIFAVYLPRKGE